MWLPIRPVYVDSLLALILTVVTAMSFHELHHGWNPLGQLVAAVLSVAPVALRQRAPLLVTLVILGAMTVNLIQDGYVPVGGIGIVVAMFTVATMRSRAVTATTVGLAMAVVIATAGTLPAELAVSEVAIAMLMFVIAWILGESTRRWSERAERAAADAERATAAERVRIARELHDIVSHHMSVISLQAGLAEYVIDEDPKLARTSIATVGEASREALLDLRRLLDVLRVDDEDDYHPQPGLADLDELLARTRAAGLPVTLTVTGQERVLPAGIDLCAYRVVQESLTNVLKHARQASARVEVDYGARVLSVTVANDGVRPARGRPAGHGIRGMRERAEFYGGVLDAGPTGGGFTVGLRVPIAERQETLT